MPLKLSLPPHCNASASSLSGIGSRRAMSAFGNRAATAFRPSSIVAATPRPNHQNRVARAGPPACAPVAHKATPLRLGYAIDATDVGAELVVEPHIAHRQVVRMHMVARRDLAGGEPDHLAVTIHRLAG